MLTRDLEQISQIRLTLIFCSSSRTSFWNKEEAEEKVKHHDTAINKKRQAQIYTQENRTELPGEGTHPINTAEQRNRPAAICYRDYIRHIGMPGEHPQRIADATNQLCTHQLKEVRCHTHTDG